MYYTNKNNKVNGEEEEEKCFVDVGVKSVHFPTVYYNRKKRQTRSWSALAKHLPCIKIILLFFLLLLFFMAIIRGTLFIIIQSINWSKFTIVSLDLIYQK